MIGPRYIACMFSAFLSGMTASWFTEHGRIGCGCAMALLAGAVFALLWPWKRDHA